MTPQPKAEPYAPPWWLSVILGILAIAVILAPVWVPIVWEALK